MRGGSGLRWSQRLIAGEGGTEERLVPGLKDGGEGVG